MRLPRTPLSIARAVAHVALAVVGLRVWQMLLLKEHIDRPGIVAIWLGTGLAVVLIAISLARRTDSEDRTRLQRRWAAIEGPDLAFVALLFILLFLFHWGFQRAASDGREYFVQIRSLVMDFDLDLSNENATFGVRGTAGNYAFGAPLLWTPFFLAVHLWLGVLNAFGAEYARDGYFNPYQQGIGLGTLIYGFIAIVLIYRLLGQYFSRRLAALATLAITCGSFVIWYLVADNSMAHGASMFATTLFVYVWHQTRGDRSNMRWAKLGAAAGLMAIVRWQNILFVILPLFEAIMDLRQSWASASSGAGAAAARGTATEAKAKATEAGAMATEAKAVLLRYGAFVAAYFLVFSPQLFFWKAVNGGWLAVPAGAHATTWSSPRLADALFSSDRGLFSWTPLLYLAVIGLLFFARRQPQLASLLFAAFVLQVYINSVVEWEGHGFGARRFANCALIFAIGLAAFLHWMKQRPGVALVAFVGLFVVVNGFFMLDMKTSQVPASGAIPFDQVLRSTTSRLGNPFSFPMSAVFALRFGADLTLYERLGNQAFNNGHIDFGASNDDRFLARGWSDRETAPDFDFRWSSGQESSFVVRLREADDYALEVECAPFPHPVDRLQVVEVWVNGELASRLALVPTMHAYRTDLPDRLMRTGLNEIVFRYGYAVSPQSLGISDDPRQLAVQFDTLSLLRGGG